MEPVDRRAFLQKAGVASAAAGAAWAAPSVLGASTAFATGSLGCSNPQTLQWASYPTMSIPSRSSTVTVTTTIPAAGANPAIDVLMTIAPVGGTPGQGTNGSYTGTGGVNKGPGSFTDGLGTTSSYYMLFMQNSAANVGYSVTFNFYKQGTTTPRSVYNLALSLGGLTEANSGGNSGYVDTVTEDTSFTTTHGTGVTGAGTTVNPWIGTTSSNTNAWVTMNHSGPIDHFTITYTGGSRYGVSEWIWINDLTWC